MKPSSSESGLVTTKPDQRAGWLLVIFIALALTVYGRLVALQLRDGKEYRDVAAQPIARKHTIPATRGRILARNGTVLAYDEPVVGLGLEYRWLEEPADRRWLRRLARSRLSASQRRDARHVAAEEEQVARQRQELHDRLASL